MEMVIFFLFAALAVGSALVVVLHRNPVYSTLSLVLTLISLAVLFVLLGAPFIAALQVLIYTGAIVVLFLFVVMLLNIGREEASGERGLLQKVAAGVGALALLAFVALAYWGAYGTREVGPLTEDFVSLEVLATQLFSDYLLAFELVGLLLLVAVIAATVLAARLGNTPGGGESDPALPEAGEEGI
ncbi:MAG TPA: NADH-quinone oxidoreductase subunit J [Thermoanaerobaculia bacterium]|nr:NADH-quinone oxidoreductase subunit J [Thermoanaerobaculia bacterium]